MRQQAGLAPQRSRSRSPGPEEPGGGGREAQLEEELEEANARLVQVQEELTSLGEERDMLAMALEGAQERAEEAQNEMPGSPEGAGLLRSQLWETIHEGGGEVPRDSELLEILSKRGEDAREMKDQVEMLQGTLRQQVEISASREQAALMMASRLDKFDSLLASNKQYLDRMETELIQVGSSQQAKGNISCTR